MGIKKDRVKKLDDIFSPKSIAVVGASNDLSKVGSGVLKNILDSKYKGRVYPVNPKRRKVLGKKCYSKVSDIEEVVDVAMIAIPARFVPDVIKDCAKTGVKAAVILSSGFKEAGQEGQKLNNKIIEIARKENIRIMGPNCMGFIRPSINLNASFSKKAPIEGNIAFISQSGALGSSTLDWALKYNLGFSFFASLGSMIDISFNDLIDYLGNDPNTESIVIYMESLGDARKFMSAARSFSLNKPIIVLKAGKSKEGARAALSHTGNLTGNDEVFDAAFKRAGIVRVEEIDDLFDCAKTLSKQKTPRGNKIAIVTNAGGPGVLSTDLLIKRGGELSKLSKKTIKELDSFLPSAWSHSNPVDILGDAKKGHFRKSIEICLKDENVDGVIVLLTPQTMTDSGEIANEISTIKSDKPILASFMGGVSVAKGKEILEKNNIPNFPFPERAVKAFMYLYDYSKNIKVLYETPGSIPHAFDPKTDESRKIINKAFSEKRVILLESEVREILENYGIPVNEQIVCKNQSEVSLACKKKGFPVAMKVLSRKILHKTDVGGVVLNIESESEALEAYRKIISNARKASPREKPKTVIVSKMLKKRYELIIGSKKDEIFGPTIVFGMGGVAVDVFRDFQIGLPPLNMHLSEMLTKDTKIYDLIKGYRGIPGADLNQLQFILYKFSYLVSDFPEIKEIDINPFSIDEEGGLVLDAKIILDEKFMRRGVSKKSNYSHLVICPYPKEFVKEVKTKDGREVTLRPIRPEDEPLEQEMFKHFSRETQRFRFFGQIKKVDHELLIKYTHNDYDRELGIFAEIEENGKKKMAGVVRLIMDPYDDSAEFAIVVADPWQGIGLGSIMTDYMLEVAKKKGVRRLYAYLLRDNIKMREMFERRNFIVSKEEKVMKAVLDL